MCGQLGSGPAVWRRPQASRPHPPSRPPAGAPCLRGCRACGRAGCVQIPRGNGLVATETTSLPMQRSCEGCSLVVLRLRRPRAASTMRLAPGAGFEGKWHVYAFHHHLPSQARRPPNGRFATEPLSGVATAVLFYRRTCPHSARHATKHHVICLPQEERGGIQPGIVCTVCVNAALQQRPVCPCACLHTSMRVWLCGCVAARACLLLRPRQASPQHIAYMRAGGSGPGRRVRGCARRPRRPIGVGSKSVRRAAVAWQSTCYNIKGCARGWQ